MNRDGGGVDDSGGADDTGGAGDRETDEASDSSRGSSGFRLGSIMDAVTHPTRREVLEYLETRRSPVPLDELADHVGEPYTITDPLRRSDDRVHQVKMQLYHVHLPKLNEEGLATFDPEDLTVTITEEGAEAMSRLF